MAAVIVVLYLFIMKSAPVIIAACNEEKFIGRALRHLPAGEVEPIVVTNGSTDATADIARGFGARVIELDEMGKLPAQQAAVKDLRDRGHGPDDVVLFMDADSYPLMPRAWVRAMSRRHDSQHGTPVFISGLVGLTDGNPAVNVLRTARRYQNAVQVAMGRIGALEAVFGINMSVRFGNEETLEEFLDMPHIWPGEDRATAQLIIDADGTFHQSLDPRSMVISSERFAIPILQRIRMSKQEVRDYYERSYARRSAPGATHTFDPVVGTNWVPLQRQPESTVPVNQD